MSERSLTEEQLHTRLDGEDSNLGVGISLSYWIAEKRSIRSWQDKNKMVWVSRRLRCTGCKEMIERGKIAVVTYVLRVDKAWSKPLHFHLKPCLGAFLRVQLNKMEQEIRKGARFIEKYDL